MDSMMNRIKQDTQENAENKEQHGNGKKTTLSSLQHLGGIITFLCSVILL